jgi:ABC-type antimicrobial peptide transport system permease subunit
MTLAGLLRRNLFFHWRGNCAVCLGVIVGTAVLTGALLVGDSLRGSLRSLTDQRLGWVEHALVAGRFLREGLGHRLPAEHVAPVVLLQGAIETEAPAGTPPRRANRVMILGVDDRFWPDGDIPVDRSFWRPAEPDNPQAAQVVLNTALAGDLGIQAGDRVTLRLQKSSAVPRESLLGRRDDQEVLARLPATVREVLADSSPGVRFSLHPSPVTPRTAFVPLRVLQERLTPTDRRTAKRRREPRVNAFLVRGGSREALQAQLRRELTLEDWDLVLRHRKERGYLSLESHHMLLEPPVVEAARAAAADTGLTAAPTLVYLANSIRRGEQEIPYSVVAALDPSLSPPLGPFLPLGEQPLRDDEILLADWKESPLKAKPGDTLRLTYFHPDSQGGLHERAAEFRLRGLVPMTGAAADPGLTPEFPGITDRLTIGDWDPPFPFDNKRVKKRDEDYWKKYRATPKAYVTLAAGQRLWGSRFGQLTSLRLAAAGDGADLDQAAEQLRGRLLAALPPEQGGLVFDDVRAHQLEASAGGTDFGGLFLGFSFFLIASALLLVGLLFRLNLDRRASEVGLLLAAGYRPRTVLRLLLAEGCLLAAVGALIGLGGAVLYAWFLLELLGQLWPGAVDWSFLHVHLTPRSLAIGYLASLAVSVLTIAWAVRALGKVSPRALLAGETTAESDPGALPRAPRLSAWVAAVAVVAAVPALLLGGRVHNHEMQAMTFFSGGALLLTAALAASWAWMRGSRHGQVRGHGPKALAQLGVRNAARHPSRSLLTAGLLAAAAFLIVAVESFRREPAQDYLARDSGSGGFVLLAEADLPVYVNLNRAWQTAVQSLAESPPPAPRRTPADRPEEELAEKLSDQLRTRLPAGNPPGSGDPGQFRTDLQSVSFVPFRVRAGDDASCLNLYQPRRPRLLGVPHSLVERGGFHWAASEGTQAEKANPWLLLEQPLPNGVIPVVGEKNTVTWMLNKGLGEELEVPNERGELVTLRIVGLLQDSVFQGELLMSEGNFLQLYPGQEGHNLFLIDAPASAASEVKAVLDSTLADRGFEATSTAQRLKDYLAVENTYLTTFQALGGLGLLLGALGLAVVLVRSIWERRGELALLRALGFRRQALNGLMLAENGFLLVLGLLSGTGSALLAVAPHLAAGEGQVPWLRLLGLLALVLVVGLGTGAAASASTLRAPLLPALRRE